MKIISHRGLWKSVKDKNSILAFTESIKYGFGIETDIRDFNSQLVISHDIPNSKSILLSDYFQICFEKNKHNITHALNIKSDGLSYELYKIINQYDVKNYFTFDMSIPDTIPYIKSRLNFFTRVSDLESSLIFYDEASGIWLDSFYKNDFDDFYITKALNDKKKVCIVSPELHGRDHQIYWQKLKLFPLVNNENLMICTDFPENAQLYFNEKD